MYKFKLLPKLNLILLKISDNKECISDVFLDADKNVFNDPDYCDDLNIIIDYRSALLPDNQAFYNDMTRKVTLKCQFDKIIRLLDEDNSKYAKHLKIFHIFYKGKHFHNKTITTYSVKDALTAAGIKENTSEYIEFLEQSP